MGVNGQALQFDSVNYMNDCQSALSSGKQLFPSVFMFNKTLVPQK